MRQRIRKQDYELLHQNLEWAERGKVVIAGDGGYDGQFFRKSSAVDLGDFD